MTDIVENKDGYVDASRIFTGHRALGLVSNHIPLVTRYIAKRKETLIATVIGNSFHTYGVSLSCLHDIQINNICFAITVQQT